MPYCMYLRKSRVDLEAEARGAGDTLRRHETALMATARAQGLTITEIFREVVSGDTIAERPVMQRLLSEVGQDLWEGVLVMEVERLARGDTIDQGIVARTFEYSNTLIVTPSKTFDPENEYDMEFFEYGLFQSRREYKAIKRRQQGGRLASVNEGKWPWNKAPYGYKRVKLQNQKGWTLEPVPENAAVITDIFTWYTKGCADGSGGVTLLGVARIVRRLHELGIPSPSGKDWTNGSVRDILRNPVYAGWVWRGHRAAVKKIDNGAVVKTRPRAPQDKVTVVRGLHSPIITQEMFDEAAGRLNMNLSRPGPKQYQTTNPMAGLIICAECGRSMTRRPYQSGRKSSLICPYTSCPTVSSDFDLVETALLSGLKNWLGALDIGDKPDLQSQDDERIRLEKLQQSISKDIDTLRQQELRAYDLVEQHIYTPEVFLERTRDLSARRAALLDKQETVAGEIEKLTGLKHAAETIVPQIKYVIDAYAAAETAEEKNQLLKSVVEKAVYSKTVNLRWHPDADDMQLVIFPRLPASPSSPIPRY